jgi:hypothetical protein
VVGAAVSTVFTVTLPAPANDNFASATLLTGTTATATGNNSTATKQAGEPNIAGNQGGKSLWYAWTAPANGKVTINTEGSNFDTLLGVYTGSVVSALTAVAQDDDTSRTDLTSTVTFSATAGTTYYIAVDGYNYGRGAGAASGNVVLNLTELQAPANDNFASATLLTGTTVTWTGTNTAATKEVGEPTIPNAPGGASIWFAWVAPTSGRVTINTEGSKFDTTLGVYTGSVVSALTKVAQNDDVSRTDLTSSVSFVAAAGTTYYIAVDGYRAATGTVVLNLATAAVPANDNFAGAAVLTGSSLTWTGTNVGASLESGEPRIAGVTGGASVWFTWVAPTSGTVTLDTHGSSFDTTLGVFTGSAVNSLTSVASNDDDWANNTLTSALQFNAVAGATYYFAVDGYHGATGNITLNLSLVQSAHAPANGTVTTGGGGSNSQPVNGPGGGFGWTPWW